MAKKDCQEKTSNQGRACSGVIEDGTLTLKGNTPFIPNCIADGNDGAYWARFFPARYWQAGYSQNEHGVLLLH
jgi:hypothetical protein